MQIFEKAFSEILRICLSYEQKVAEINAAVDANTGHKYAMDALMDLVGILERSDVKAKLLGELFLLEKKMSSYDKEQVDHASLEALLRDLAIARVNLATKAGSISKDILSDPLVSKLYFKHQGVDADLPLQSWLHQGREEKSRQLKYWLAHAQHYTQAVSMILHIYRGITGFKNYRAESGFYRESSLDRDLMSIHLIRIQIQSQGCYPILSLAKRWLAITFYESGWRQNQFCSEPAVGTVSFTMAVCSSQTFAQYNL